jgi:autotransporter-associated beta strand protein
MGGTLTNEGSIAMEIANDVGHKGAVYQSGGAFYPYSAKLANKASSGTYVLSGGTAFFSGDLLINFGGTGTGEVAVTSGTLTQSGGLFAVGNGAGIAYYTQSGGTVTVYTNSIASGTGIGMFTISNGTFNATAFGQLASGVGATGIMLLAGGTTTLPAFPTTRGVNASAIVTFDGGTLSPRASTNGYLRGLTAAYVTTNGAVLDTAGYDITISQKLEDYSGHTGRLVKKGAGTLTLSGTNTYSGATIVTNGVLSQTHAQCLSASSTVYLYSTATNNLSFEGTNTIRRLYVDNVLQQEKKAYSKTQFAVLSGNGYYYVTEGAKAPGTMVSFF